MAPGLPEAEVIAGDPSRIAITLLRCVGSLSRQCAGTLEARLWLISGLDAAAAREAEVGLIAVTCGDAPLVAEGEPLLEVEPASVLVSALKPAEQGDRMVLRLSNPTAVAQEARIKLGFRFDEVESLRLDETPDGQSVDTQGDTLHVRVVAHGLRTLGISQERHVRMARGPSQRTSSSN